MSRGVYMTSTRHSRFAVALLSIVALIAVGGVAGCAEGVSERGDGRVTVYSGRVAGLMAHVVSSFEEETGVHVTIHYGKPAELEAAIRKNPNRADVFVSSDASPLADLNQDSLLAKLPSPVVSKVASRYRGEGDRWVGVTAWTQALTYNTQELRHDEVPTKLTELADPKWRGKVALNPSSRAFQAAITAMRASQGEQRTQEFLAALASNQARVFHSSAQIIKAVHDGEVSLGLVNHEDWYQQRNYHPTWTDNVKPCMFARGDLGQVMNTSAVGVLNHARGDADTRHFVAFLLAREPQQHFTNRTFEYPLAADTDPAAGLPRFSSLSPPPFALDSLADRASTERLIAQAGLRPSLATS